MSRFRTWAAVTVGFFMATPIIATLSGEALDFETAFDAAFGAAVALWFLGGANDQG